MGGQRRWFESVCKLAYTRTHSGAFTVQVRTLPIFLAVLSMRDSDTGCCSQDKLDYYVLNQRKIQASFSSRDTCILVSRLHVRIIMYTIGQMMAPSRIPSQGIKHMFEKSDCMRKPQSPILRHAFQTQHCLSLSAESHWPAVTIAKRSPLPHKRLFLRSERHVRPHAQTRLPKLQSGRATWIHAIGSPWYFSTASSKVSSFTFDCLSAQAEHLRPLPPAT